MFSKARQLTILQWRYVAASWLVLPLVDISLKVVGYRRTRCLLRYWVPVQANTCADRSGAGLQIARAVSIAARHSVWPTSCLRQALVYWWFMLRRGTWVDIHIGVEGGTGQPFAAHAWVELDGQILLGGEHVRKRYVVLQ